jgi:hypothetical protein
VPVARRQLFYDALKTKGVPAEFQEFTKGNHATTATKGSSGMRGRSGRWNGLAIAGC